MGQPSSSANTFCSATTSNFTQMQISYFVKPGSKVRQIWSDRDAVLFIFAGSAAEFALNPSVDWLFFTGKLPSDPIGRFLSTLKYAHEIIFMPFEQAMQAIGRIVLIHNQVEDNRKARIPPEAYRYVLYMLIDYTLRAGKLFYPGLSGSQCEEIFDVFYRMGRAMNIPGLPGCYNDWRTDRARQLSKELKYNTFTPRLFAAYRRQLGVCGYWFMKQVQREILPREACGHLSLQPSHGSRILVAIFVQFRQYPVVLQISTLLAPAVFNRFLSTYSQPTYVKPTSTQAQGSGR
ncbi:MAG: DUF2236 domain-containing protein [Chitinophagia bacterium]|nr:DUF2236 domain-containing protein [Chitinophagia bacterium]